MLPWIPFPPRRRSCAADGLALELLRDLLQRPAAEEADLVATKRRIIANLYPEPVVPLDLLQPVRPLLNQVDRHIRMHPKEQLLVPGPLTHAAEHPLDLQRHGGEGQHASASLTLSAV